MTTELSQPTIAQLLDEAEKANAELLTTLATHEEAFAVGVAEGALRLYAMLHEQP